MVLDILTEAFADVSLQNILKNIQYPGELWKSTDRKGGNDFLLHSAAGFSLNDVKSTSMPVKVVHQY